MITVDETPIGVYMEIEGSTTSIVATAKILGFQQADFITSTYLDLFRKYESTNRVKNGNMTFDIQA
jgi:adenylate cyclase class 2